MAIFSVKFGQFPHAGLAGPQTTAVSKAPSNQPQGFDELAGFHTQRLGLSSGTAVRWGEPWENWDSDRKWILNGFEEWVYFMVISKIGNIGMRIEFI